MATITTAILGKKNVTAMSISNNDWVDATVEKIVIETPSVKTFTFKLPHAMHNIAGQHYELRLTATNGYQAARPYSSASAMANSDLLELTIQHVPGGEVTSYLHSQLKVGDPIQARGPFGKFFVWEPTMEESIFLIAGGAGVVPMHSIITSHRDSGSTAEMKLLYSARTFDDIIYKDDFLTAPTVEITLTKNQPADWHGRQGRINQAAIKEILDGFSQTPSIYICGMSPFVNAVTDGLLALGISPATIKTERFN